MHLTDLRIDEIVKVNGLPSFARSRATFTSGRTCDFDTHFTHGYEDARIFVRRSTDGRPMDPTTRTALSHERPSRVHRNAQARALARRGLRVRARHRPAQDLMRPGKS